MKRAIVTGAAGFTGAVLCEVLRKKDIEVYALVRNGSEHNRRLDTTDRGLHVLDARLGALDGFDLHAGNEYDFFFHLAWTGGSSVEEQNLNIDYTLDALRMAKKVGCRRFIATGSQAEYGVVPMNEYQTEDREPAPFTAYGIAKVKSCKESRNLAEKLDVEWIWGRIFSLIGKYEPVSRMLPGLYHALKDGKEFKLSSCRQNWDYLDVYDAAEALLALAERGHAGEIYNIANGNYKPLRKYTEELRQNVNPTGMIIYGEDPDPFVSLQPSIVKIQRDTGWKPMRSFEDSIADYELFD